MFLINLQGKETIYEQIRSQIEKFVASGILKPNDKLPSVRNLASDLGINPNTVMKAYQELESAGYIYALNKKGVFVAKDINIQKKESRTDVFSMLNVLKDEGYEKEEIVEILNDVYKEVNNA